MAAFNLEERSRAVCTAYKAAQETALGEDSPPTTRKAHPLLSQDNDTLDNHVRKQQKRVTFAPDCALELAAESRPDAASQPKGLLGGAVPDQGDANIRSEQPPPAVPSTTDKNERPAEHGDGDGHIDCIPPRPEPRVPTDRVFRMLLSLLKRNPAGIVKDVGVQLMLFASSIEVTKVCPPAPTLDQRRASNRATELERRKQRDQRGELERQAEATCILTLARRAERSRAISMAETGGGTLNGTNATPAENQKKKRCKLRKTIKVEDGLQDWAAKSGHNISEFVRLLGLFRGIEPANAKLVRDRVVRIPAGAAAKALPEAGVVLKFIYNAVVMVVGEPDPGAANTSSVAGSARSEERPMLVGKTDDGSSGKSEQGFTFHDRGPPPGSFITAEGSAPKDAVRIRDPMGDVPLVNEDGERNLWDEILEDQLSKCPPLAFVQSTASTNTASGRLEPGHHSEDRTKCAAKPTHSPTQRKSRRKKADGGKEGSIGRTTQPPRLPTVPRRRYPGRARATSARLVEESVKDAKAAMGTGRSRARDLGRRGLSSSALASDVCDWNWATVGGIGRDDRAQVHGEKGGGETARGLVKSLMSSGKPWGSTVLESKLRGEWCAGEEDGSICDSPAIRCLEVGRDPSRAEQKKEREDARRIRVEARKKKGGLSQRPSVGHAWRTRFRVPPPPSSSAPLRFTRRQARMTQRWPAALLPSSKALIAEVPRLEEHGRLEFEAVFERSARRGLLGRAR